MRAPGVPAGECEVCGAGSDDICVDCAMNGMVDERNYPRRFVCGRTACRDEHERGARCRPKELPPTEPKP